MKPKTLKILSLMLCMFLAACNYPGLGIGATSTPTPTPVTPTNTPPPTPTNTPIPPISPSSTPEQPTATIPPAMLPPTQAPPTSTLPPTPVSVVTPYPRGKYEGSFSEGKITLRINDKGNSIALKQVILRVAQCNDGKTINDSITFDGVLFFPIDKARFSISMTTNSGTVVVNGIFTNPNTATGSLKVTYADSNRTCTVGPLTWAASLSD